jgi:hypothetical protein
MRKTYIEALEVIRRSRNPGPGAICHLGGYFPINLGDKSLLDRSFLLFSYNKVDYFTQESIDFWHHCGIIESVD